MSSPTSLTNDPWALTSTPSTSFKTFYNLKLINFENDYDRAKIERLIMSIIYYVPARESLNEISVKLTLSNNGSKLSKHISGYVSGAFTESNFQKILNGKHTSNCEVPNNNFNYNISLFGGEVHKYFTNIQAKNLCQAINTLIIGEYSITNLHKGNNYFDFIDLNANAYPIDMSVCLYYRDLLQFDPNPLIPTPN